MLGICHTDGSRRFQAGTAHGKAHWSNSDRIRRGESSPVSIQTQSLPFLAVFVYATHATQAIAFEWKPGFTLFVIFWLLVSCVYTAGYPLF